jgi:glucose/arabinose dehydrogenase
MSWNTWRQRAVPVFALLFIVALAPSAQAPVAQALVAQAPVLDKFVFLPFFGSSPGAVSPTRVALIPVAPGLNGITDIANVGDDRLFVAEQGGAIRIVQNGKLLDTPFLTIAPLTCCSERGLLGLAFHPDYKTNGYFYVNYTYTVGGVLRTRVARYRVQPGNPNLADPNSALSIIEFAQPYDNHNGGALHFGPDGYLYIATGDGGSAYDPQNNAQNTGTLLGKLLRIDVDASTGAGADCGLAPGRNYRIPAGNPLANGSGAPCDEIGSYGLRNPWRFAFDRGTGDLWIADVGQASREEIDVQAAGAAGGANYGWDCYEGSLNNTTDRSPACTNNRAAYVFPIHEYDHSGGKCAITGGYVYRGARYAALTGLYFFADYCSAELWTLRLVGGAPKVTALTITGATLTNPRTFGEDAAGELYVASDTTVYRIEPR